MTRERKDTRQSFFDTLTSGELKFFTESVERRTQPRARVQKERTTNRWWEAEGLEVFSKGAESWKQKLGSETLYISDIDLNLGPAEMSLDSAEEQFRESLRRAKGFGITSFDVAIKIKNQAILIRANLQGYSKWLGAYLGWIGNVLADEYRVTKDNRKRLINYLESFVDR